jgi:hypothetical protein
MKRRRAAAAAAAVEDWTRWQRNSLRRLSAVTTSTSIWDSSILRFFDFSLDGSQEIEGGGWTDPTSILGFFDFSIYVWTGSQFCRIIKKQRKQLPKKHKNLVMKTQKIGQEL